MTHLIFALIAVFFTFCNGAPSVDNGSWRVVGGSDAKVGAAPHQVILRADNFFACSGSILSKKTIVTAAHCVSDQSLSSLSVTTGTNLLNSGGTNYDIESVIVHADYNGWEFANDIAIMVVKGEIQFSELVSPISIGESEITGDADVTLSGWGRTSYPGDVAERLQVLPLKTLSHQKCKDMWTSNSVVGSMICTLTKEGEGACHGDSGGPLVYGNLLVGIVSWGSPCARAMPDVYTRVSSFTGWIKDNMV